MNTLQETFQNGYYHVDTPLTKDDWLSVLCDESTPKTYIDALLKFYYEPNHESTCSNLGQMYPQPYASFNANVRSLGMLVQKRFGFNVETEKGDAVYWNSVMDGREVGGNFSWRIKEELAEAIQEYLYRYLLEKYKEHRKTVHIDAPKTTERYKWELITECERKPLVEIAHRIRTTNLVYTNLANGTINWLYNNRHDEYAAALQTLVGEDSLSNRLQKCSKAIHRILDENEETKNFKFAADDERTLSTILTCYNPDQYTFYMEKSYLLLCKFLGMENENSVGKKYPHFLQLLQPLVKLINSDSEIHAIVDPSLEGLRQSDLLLAQDVCWEMLVKNPGKLSYPPKKKEMHHYWCVGHNIDSESQLESFVNNKTWKAIFRKNEDVKQLKDSLKVREGDRLILKSSYTKGEKHNISILNIQAVGIVTGKPSTFDPHRDGYEGVEVCVNYISRDRKEFNANDVGSYRNTIKETNNQTIIDYVESLTQKKMERISKYKKLLEGSHNLILTGAPGTGKTFLAKELAASVIGCEPNEVDRSDQFGFVQFHPSYDYTDFVEGLRPTESDDGNNVGFELRDGIFKSFCEKALKNIADSEKSAKELGKEESAQKALEAFLEEATSETENDKMLQTLAKKSEFFVESYDDRHITITIPKNEKVKSITIRRDDLIQVLSSDKEMQNLQDVKDLFHEQNQRQQDSYILAIYREIIDRKPLNNIAVNNVERKNFVFVIDEINRGDISKILGELFFSVDPGYRGVKGKVTTQYANMQSSANIFDRYLGTSDYGHFFVPSNVFIIGTMNDIDRSVESMDFAMRRRFAWKEVTAEESMDMLDNCPQLDAVREEIKSRMRNLNHAIEGMDELGRAYDIGAAYFLKYSDYGNFDDLWEYHLKGVLCEYLRGERDPEKKLEELHKAYNNDSASTIIKNDNEG